MRELLLLGLLLAPTASGVSVDLSAPAAAPVEPLPFAVDVSVADAEGPVDLKAWLGGDGWQASRTWNTSTFQRSDHYALTIDPGPDGTWDGRLWLKANPSSRNADRLASDELAIGVRARSTGEVTDALADVEPITWNASSWAAAGPERPLTLREGTRPLVELGSPGQRTVVEVPAPRSGFTVCSQRTCEGELGWRLQRAGEHRVVLSQLAGGVGSEGGVLVVDGRACLLPKEGPPSERWPIELDRLYDEACRSVPDRGAAARLLHQGEEVSRAPERPGRGEVVRDPIDRGWAPWRLPRGFTPEPVEAVPVEGRVEVFGTRTAGLSVIEDVLDRAEHRVTVSTYLLTSDAVTQRLVETAARGVDVHLWLEPDPVGGLPDQTPRLVDRLQAAGVRVHEAEGPTRSGLQHAKILVVDSGLVLVLTENLTEHGIPSRGEGNLGVGIGVANASLAARVEATFRSPGEPRELRPDAWSKLEAPVALLRSPENTWRPEGVPAWIEESEGALEGAVLRANPRWGPRSNAWLEAMVDHSRQAPVDVILSGAPAGAARSNREAIAHLEAHPDAGALTARLSDPRDGTVHAKTIVTSTGALVGSSNWGLGGVLLNREVNLLVHDETVAREVREVLAGGEEGSAFPDDAIPRPAYGPGVAGVVVAVLAGLAWRPISRWVLPRGRSRRR